MSDPHIPVHHLPAPSRMPTRVERFGPKPRPMPGPVHRHDFNELFFFTQGGGAHMIDLERIAFTAPCVHVVAPGQVHQLERSPSSAGLVVMFSPEALLGQGHAARAELFAWAQGPKSFAVDAAQLAEAPMGGCLPTTDDILGPSYLAGSPVTTLVADTNEPGDHLFIAGTVLSSICITSVPNAMIEVWQANAAAVYDTSTDFRLRATLYSDANGQYAFETIMPGDYLNGNQYRPRHIHFRVNHAGFPELTTQLYFEGDPYIPADPWASQPDAVQRIIPLNPIGGTAQEGVFDIVLDGQTAVKPNRFGTEGDLLPVHPNPMRELGNIHFNVFRPARAAVHIADLQGRVLVTLVDESKAQGRYTTAWDDRAANGSSVGAGTYLCLLQLDGRPVKAQRIVKQ
ncbi:MAG: hypothetical protein IPJ87_08725 [Flavobacteriales bacterium]|nr:hypothetical protein [Flavobacteriales bacterium]MBK7941945.1 hypothetical protein [Flavobacteriales bacterium]MBK9700488.1 hypothetical protein [Flavobacteriales bacterium]